MDINNYWDKIGFLPEEHKTTAGFYTIGLEKIVYRGKQQGSACGILHGYIYDRSSLNGIEEIKSSEEWLVKRNKFPNSLISHKFKNYSHLVIIPDNIPKHLIIAPQTLERIILVNLHEQTNQDYQHQKYQAMHQHRAIRVRNLMQQMQ